MSGSKQVSARQKLAGKKPLQQNARKAPKKTTTVRRPSKFRKKSVGLRKKYKFKPGTKALKEIRRYQKSMELLIPKAPFIRLVEEIMTDILSPRPAFRIQALAISALREAAKSTLVTEFELTNLAAIHAKRVTIQQKDMKLVQAMRKGMMGYSFPGQME